MEKIDLDLSGRTEEIHELLNTKRSVNYVSVVTNVIRLSRILEVPTSNLCQGPIILCPPPMALQPI